MHIQTDVSQRNAVGKGLLSWHLDLLFKMLQLRWTFSIGTDGGGMVQVGEC